jgi:hypothetical protein
MPATLGALKWVARCCGDRTWDPAACEGWDGRLAGDGGMLGAGTWVMGVVTCVRGVDTGATATPLPTAWGVGAGAAGVCDRGAESGDGVAEAGGEAGF